mgnify:CR=1 FL=1
MALALGLFIGAVVLALALIGLVSLLTNYFDSE